ncbi:MAG TPA: DUF3500 domain-containing protein [Woeseiaceae bacterium]|jgi:hypothetical protein|nr:DUF3500 domain-containing protein [Woeseiaceae bacterium]
MNNINRIAYVLGLSMLALSAPGVAASSTDAISAAATAFLDTLNEEQLTTATMPLATDERATWSNLPIVMVQPAGILVKDMTVEQRRAAHALMRATMSSQGYAKFAGIMLLDDLLHQLEAEALQQDDERRNDPRAKVFLATRDYGNYAVAIFGDPGDENWGWKIAGHHAAANFTISDGRLGFTPTFLGSSPMEIRAGRYAGLMALAHEGQRGISFMRSLDGEQQKQATIAAEAASDVFEGPGRRASLKTYEGLSVKGLSDNQKHLLHRLIAEFLHNADHDAAHAQMQAIRQAGWDKLWFSWRGPVDPDGEFYYRVHGPRILIEYNRQDANHDHMIVRDPANDYGEDWLGRHYKEHHPTMEEARENVRRAATESGQ